MTEDTMGARRAGSCQSCSMTIDDGQYCQYCVDEHGSLRSFDETFERFIQFAMGRDRTLDRASAESSTLRFMSTMPAWADSSELRSRLK
ncbi:MAG: hypothetical protein KDB80_02065 [Planctomycetes bacterium]|nr:hypothetical protein [Planctomycetota bacterium]